MAFDLLLTDRDDQTPMQRCLTAWHDCLTGGPAGLAGLDDLLADDVVLHSPVLFRPIEGKELVTLYLSGAAMTFVGEHGTFRYVRTIVGERDAALEFETTMDGRHVNGVDLISIGDDGRIVDVKVMVRPQQAVEAVRLMMGAALETLRQG